MYIIYICSLWTNNIITDTLKINKEVIKSMPEKNEIIQKNV